MVNGRQRRIALRTGSGTASPCRPFGPGLLPTPEARRDDSFAHRGQHHDTLARTDVALEQEDLLPGTQRELAILDRKG
jgi:hypothetical protein